jgi:hypothetical protein
MTGGAIRRWGGGFILAIIVGAIGMGLGRTSPTPGPSSTATSSTPSVPAAASAPAPEPTYELTLISSRGYESEGGEYHIVEGQVRNVSSQPLKNVTAVATWFDKDGGFIKSDDALIDYNPSRGALVLLVATAPLPAQTQGLDDLQMWTRDCRRTASSGTRSG